MDNRQDIIKNFVEAWKYFANYVLDEEGLLPEDVQVCNDALTVLDTDIPKKLFEEVLDSPVVHQSTIDEAEEFDKSLMRLKLGFQHLSIEQRKSQEKAGEGCISLQKLLLMIIVQGQGRLRN